MWLGGFLTEVNWKNASKMDSETATSKMEKQMFTSIQNNFQSSSQFIPFIHERDSVGRLIRVCSLFNLCKVGETYNAMIYTNWNRKMANWREIIGKRRKRSNWNRRKRDWRNQEYSLKKTYFCSPVAIRAHRVSTICSSIRLSSLVQAAKVSSLIHFETGKKKKNNNNNYIYTEGKKKILIEDKRNY